MLTGKGTVDQLERKGFTPVVAPENLVSAAAAYGVQTSASVLSADELSGREITDATPDAQAAVNLRLGAFGGHRPDQQQGKTSGQSFSSILDGGTMLNGYYRDGVVFVNRDLAGDASLVAGRNALTDRLLKVALEELSHYVTGATDNSRDFQDYLLEVAVKLARHGCGSMN